MRRVTLETDVYAVSVHESTREREYMWGSMAIELQQQAAKAYEDARWWREFGLVIPAAVLTFQEKAAMLYKLYELVRAVDRDEEVTYA